MNITMNIDPEMLADHLVLFILLGLVEQNNEDFLLNKSEAWKELIDLIEKKSIRIKLLQRFFKIKSMRRQKFKKLQNIMYR